MKKKATAVLIFVVFGILLIVSFLPFKGTRLLDLVVNRNKELRYKIEISPTGGNKLRDVTLYLPFPREEAHLQSGLLNELNTAIKLTENRNVTLSEVNTTYGPMLKVYFPELSKPFISDIISTEYRYRTFLPTGKPFNEYPLPVLTKQDSKCTVPIYVTHKGASKIELSLYYHAGFEDSYLFLFPGLNGGRSWMLSQKKKQADEPLERKVIMKQGWSNIRVWISDSGSAF